MDTETNFMRFINKICCNRMKMFSCVTMVTFMRLQHFWPKNVASETKISNQFDIFFVSEKKISCCKRDLWDISIFCFYINFVSWPRIRATRKQIFVRLKHFTLLQSHENLFENLSIGVKRLCYFLNFDDRFNLLFTA